MESVILMMIAVSLLLAAAAASALIWGLKGGQFGEQAAFLQLRDDESALADAISLEQRAADFAAPGLLLLDRDGVINRDVGYLCEISQCELLSGALALAIAASKAGWQIAVATNQSGIARGYFTAEKMHALHDHIAKEYAKRGVQIRAFYHCPHGPDDGCNCRKPAPGMLLAAMSELQKRPEQCIFCGDKPSDMQAAKNANIKGYLISCEDDFRKVIDENFSAR